MIPQEFIGGHYRILSKLGQGGMGEVWRANDTKLNRDVAIKILPEAFAEDADRMARFTREAQILASLNHPNIAAIYAVEARALVIELVEGPTLAERIEQGCIPLDEALPVARQIIEALEYAHERNVVHRDLKPANIKITPEGRVKVLDFGLAKAMANDTGPGDPMVSPTLTMRATMAGTIMGTAAYMSPEQARGKNVDKRADIWAFGVVFYEMLTGRSLFGGGETVSDSLAAVITRDPDWADLPAGTPAPIRKLLERCLRKDPKIRLRDIGEARIAVDEPLTPSDAVSKPAPPMRRRFPWWTAAAFVLALAGIAVGVVHFGEPHPDVTPVRFEIPAPEKLVVGNGGIAISPDGRRLAFIAAGADGSSKVWVRSLDSLAARVLPGTDGAGYLPFWSPDSRFIAFGAGGTLKKVDAGGGPPQTLCEISASITGGSWNSDGVILFGHSSSGIYRVSQAGGVPTQITTPDEAHGEAGHLRPWFLSDGRHFIYIARTNNAEQSINYLASLDSKERTRLVATRQAAAYAPPTGGSKFGHLLFLRDNTLMAQPMDPRRYELTGEPFPVAEHVGSLLAMGWFSVSANGVLVYRSGESAGDQLAQLAWFDRQGKPLGSLGPAGAYFGLELSPDGARVAVDELDNSTRDIWILDAARGVPTRFTFDPGVHREPHWSPDGSRLVFASDRGHGGRWSIYQKPSNGSGNEELLLDDTAPLLPGGWSPDGRRLIYQRIDAKTNLDLWILPLSPGGKPEVYLQTPFVERQPQFSPDGRWVAYASNESISNQYQVYVQPFPPGAGKFQVSTGAGGAEPHWRRDGKEIFYLGADGKLMAVEIKTQPRFEAGVPQALFDTHIVTPTLLSMLGSFKYDVTPDGRRFLVDRISTAADQRGTVAPITVVLNWQAGVKP